MYYITARQPPRYAQISLMDILTGNYDSGKIVNYNPTGTVTRAYKELSLELQYRARPGTLTGLLHEFNERTEELRTKNRRDLYHSFKIPKRSGGWRQIDAPLPELMNALNDLKRLLEDAFGADHIYHTNAYAYIKGRSTVSAVKVHQRNASRWFAKLDLHNFFGSTTLDFVMKQFGMVYPFCEVVKFKGGEEELRKALELAFLDGVLPQGTPISPLITNIMMVPLDYQLTRYLEGFKVERVEDGVIKTYDEYFAFTRYADDYIISCKYGFDVRKIEELLVSVLEHFDAPFSINSKKTRYGSSAGRNWNLGVMLNKDNEMTVGNKAKRNFQSALHNYARDRRSGTKWELGDIQHTLGLLSYYKMIEGDTMDRICDHVSRKEGFDIIKAMKEEISCA